MDENKEQKRRQKLILITSMTLTGVLCLAGGLIGGYFINKLPADEQKLVDEYRVLKDDWLYGNEATYLGDNAAAGLISGVSDAQDDPYTFYTQNYTDQGLGTDHLGFGFTSHSYDGGLYLTEIHTGNPSSSAGPSEGKLFIGDVLYGVTRGADDYYDFASHSYADVQTYLSQTINATTPFVFKVKRGDGSAVKDVTIYRGNYTERYIDVLQTPAVANGNVLAVRINTFLGNPTSSLRGTLDYYLSRGSIDKLVIDLRGNGGGYVNEADSMAKLFVDKGTLIYKMIDKNGKTISQDTQNAVPTYTIPSYSVLIDSNTASASEIFTLAMRAGTNATVLGLKSYGKGIAQEFQTFADGSVLRYTAAYVYGPERKNETMYDEGTDSDAIMCIQGKGIIPDQTFSTDYIYLQGTLTLDTSLAVNQASMNFLLKMMTQLHSTALTSSTYNDSYHFDDLLRETSAYLATEYSDTSLLSRYQSNGNVSKALNDKIVKTSYDGYLAYYSELTKESLS